MCQIWGNSLSSSDGLEFSMRNSQRSLAIFITALVLTACGGQKESATPDHRAGASSLVYQNLTAALKSTTGNPFVNGVMYLNPDYTRNTQLSAAKVAPDSLDARLIARMAQYPTGIWLDSIMSLAGGANNGGRLSLTEHLDAAAAQAAAAGQDAVLTLVVYDLPNRDCAALASNGELQGTAGLATYKSQYIDAIYEAIQSKPAYQHVRVVVVLEPDSLPNLVTNLSVPACAEAHDKGLYVGGITYAIGKLGSLSNVYIYLDIAHAGWMGWSNNMTAAVALYKEVVSGVNQGDLSVIRGFATDISNYTPLQEPYLSPNDLTVLNGDFYQSNPCFDELTYVKTLTQQFSALGFQDFGFLIDTSRNGWPLVNDGNPIDRRILRGNWCNVKGAGVGQPPQVSPPLYDKNRRIRVGQTPRRIRRHERGGKSRQCSRCPRQALRPSLRPNQSPA